MKKFKKIYPWIIWSVIVVIIAAYLYLFFVPSGNKSQYNENNIEDISCPIEYSNIECINNTPVIGFYNPNNISLENIRLIVPTEAGVDIYNVNESLTPDITETLVIFNSPCSLQEDKIKLNWCCGECYNTYMKNPTEDLKVSK